MKKLLRSIGLTGISLLYCFVIGISSGIPFNADAAVAKHGKAANESYSATVTARSFQHIVQTENSFSASSHARPVSLKNLHSEYSACIKVTEQLLYTSFLQYSFYSHKLLISLQKTDLIFPFHYFW